MDDIELTGDDAIRTVVAGLCRPHRSGGDVIERAAIMAAGSRANEILAWIAAHDGKPEEAIAAATPRGLHGARMSGGTGTQPLAPRRYVLPAGALA